ncbi:hypothetical protein [Sunxiuqinia elliptica]|uniref:Lipoprotein n=1 Tax=Sunxiuqinia elliptica TaxID=655355 RepID=A0A4V3BZ89_9BACT|nr:hypothetical protein [Sunxiuqinia elliptica]TDO05589.1 hypothetical protein DET52_101953 [Sunxiuqinia elliptica]TDO65133.1 hypothetical protein DET65_1511 [Sunxiuqinia elliptica]
MKSKSVILSSLLVVFLSGCMVFSFYPLYTEEDLFPNDLLVGEWVDADSITWQFDFNYFGKPVLENRDSTAFILRMKEKDSQEFSKQEFLVRVIELGGHYFLDFYVEEYLKENDLTFFDLHLMPVHTFAKLELDGDDAKISWFSGAWLEELIEQNRTHIRHENNGNHILLTAKPQELQEFVVRYVNAPDAFDDGLSASLHRIAN